MGTKLYVGNLSYSTTDESLAAAFAAFGTVASARVIMDRETGRSKGFGFVEMSSDAETKAAAAGWDGKELDGRAVKVAEAKPPENAGRRGGAGGGNRGGGFGGPRGPRGGGAARGGW